MNLFSRTILTCLLFTPFMVCHHGWADEASASKPNVVYIMADDLGWGDISAHGGGVATPNIDKLFKQGVELTHPEVVRTLVAKMDSWAESLGAALSHQPAPAKLSAKPAPEDEVLEVTVTVTDKSKPSDRLIVPFASWGGRQVATDWIEFDIAFSSNTPKRHPFFSPMRGNDETAASLLFKKGIGIDQHNREQASGPGQHDPANQWEHRSIGLCSNAPGPIGKHGLVFSGGTPGTYTVYLDNLRLRHADGNTTPIWEKGQNTRVKKSPDTESFINIQVQTVSAAGVSITK